MNNCKNVWVEKYRPTDFNNIVLDSLNKTILTNIIDNSYFPNLLFHGPPGTGKTTTINNLINAYQTKLNIKNKYMTIHLNASDERGIDVIRNQISLFVNTKSIFQDGMKFVVLDEVDYMTKTAQQALRYLLQNFPTNVRFCLICNYISKIDEGLQNDFIKLRFNQLPINDTINVLKTVLLFENIKIDEYLLINIQKIFKSDIRSMINFLQSNQYYIKHNNKNNNDTTNENNNDTTNENNNDHLSLNVINDDIWNNITDMLHTTSIQHICDYIYKLSIEYNLDKKNIIIHYLNYIIRNNKIPITSNILHNIENIIHTNEYNININICYILIKLSKLIN